MAEDKKFEEKKELKEEELKNVNGGLFNEGRWVCLKCGTRNSLNTCTKCGNHRP